MAAQALARAFWDDPLMGYIWPDDAMRRTLLPIFMRGAIQLAAPYGESFTAGSSPIGGACWLPPGNTKIPTLTVIRILLPNIWRWRLGPLQRFGRIMDEFDKKHHTAFQSDPAPKDHWYLMLLGIDPPRQGQGLGGLLMSDVLQRADAQGRKSYLETQKARNVPFYEKHGFAVVEHFNCDSGRGPECWTMLRQPRK
ncbi:MAG: GNAT family N-acetyltransferase [Gemmatimonadaceae bacterium]